MQVHFTIIIFQPIDRGQLTKTPTTWFSGGQPLSGRRALSAASRSRRLRLKHKYFTLRKDIGEVITLH